MRFRQLAILLLIFPVCMAALYPIAERCYIPKAQASPRVGAPSSLSDFPISTYLLDKNSEAIFTNATHIQVFRLMESDPETFPTKAQAAELNKGIVIDDYEVIGRGNTQGRDFAKQLASSLWRVGDPKSPNRARPNYLQCFEPGVAFRAWRGKDEATAFVCFRCSGVEVITHDAHGHVIWHGMVGLGDQRATLLALSKEALPKDAVFQSLKS